MSPRPKFFTFYRNVMLSLLLFLLIGEWFRPFMEVFTDADDKVIRTLLAAFAGFMLFDVIPFPRPISWGMKGLVCLLALEYLFSPELFLSLAWLGDYRDIIARDIAAVLRGEFVRVSAENRIVIVLCGWMIILSMLQAHLIRRSKGFWLVMFAIVCLVGLQLWPGVDTSAGLVRTVGIGLVLLALLHLPRLGRHYGFQPSWSGWTVPWLAVIALIVSAVLGSGLFFARNESTAALPIELKAEIPSWFPYAQWIETFSDNGGRFNDMVTIAKTGYGISDARLGGPLQLDRTIAFVAKTEHLTYWRGESKNIYDGNGWVQTEREVLQANVGESLPFDQTVKRDSQSFTQEIWLRDPHLAGQLFAGGPIERIEDAVTADGQHWPEKRVLFYPGSEKYRLQQPYAESPNPQLAYYRVKVFPAIRADVAQPGAEREHTAFFKERSSVLKDELQLPASLPERVIDLSKRITANSANDYERAMAIEKFLKSSYTYSLDSSEHPRGNRDFVDHFLFEQKAGYCNHFSTAMVVMLRTLGIPSRWVKGFSPGEAAPSDQVLVSETAARATASTERLGDSRLTVVVRNSDAHSWVEAYLPGIGWISFDPTPGFPGFSQQKGDSSQMARTMKSDDRAAVETESSAIPSERPNKPSLIDLLQTAAHDVLEQSAPVVSSLIGPLFIIAAALLCAAGIAVFYRDRLYICWMFQRYRNAPLGKKAYLGLLERFCKKIFAVYGRKAGCLTFREYVQSLPLANEELRLAMRDFVHMYEQARYGGDSVQQPLTMDRIKEVWKRTQRLKNV